MSDCTFFSIPPLMVGHMVIDAEETNRVYVGDEKAEPYDQDPNPGGRPMRTLRGHAETLQLFINVLLRTR
jgi:hypothetical protein